MRERLAALGAGPDVDGPPDVYGDGPVTGLEERVAGLLRTEAAVFFPTGTMAQQVALRYGADRTGNPTVALHPLGHLEHNERHAYAILSGLRPAWPTTEPRHPTAEEVAALGEPVGSLVIELPLRHAGFVLPTWAELQAVVEAARAIGARVHFDGARLWESASYLEHSVAEIAGLADSTYVSFYKSLGGIGGAALTGSAELSAYARVWRHRYGGQLFQQWPAALAALSGLDAELPRLPEYVRHARTVASVLATLPGARVHPDPPHTHQFQLWLPHPAEALNTAALALAVEEKDWFVAGWRDAPIPGLAMAELTVAGPALEWRGEEIADLAARFLARVLPPPTV
jgi:threonine aldolase